jgi:FtsP/CotA-like multicopper oxidase with cupredoxin domain
MQPTVFGLGTITRWKGETTKHLRSFVQRRTILGLISLGLGGMVPLAVAQGPTPPTQPTSSAAVNEGPVASVANPCPRFSAGGVVDNPPALFSSGGVLRVRFSYQTRTDANNRQLFCFMTPSGLENPTLHLHPGDHLIITVTNNATQGVTSDSMGPMAINAPNCGDNTMTNASMNIHYHGTNTSPVCGQDEVIKTIVNPGQTFQYDLQFPANEAPGLYWYHPHIHGISDPIVMGGATGAIVVEGIHNVQPEVAGLPQRILVIRDQPQIQGLAEGAGGCTNGVPFRDLTVNNVPIDSNQAVANGPVTFTPAVIHVRAGEKEYWRVSNTSADTILDLQVQYDGVAQTLLLAAIDGVPVNSQDSNLRGQPIPVTHFRLPPASRAEFIVRTPSSRVSSAQLVTTSINTGSAGDCDPNRPILNIASGDDGQAGNDQINDARVANYSGLSDGGRRFAGLATAPVAQSRLVFFDENPNTNQFFMAVAGQPEAVFDPNNPPAITATQGTVEQWTVENHAMENHEFHIHQIHFLLQSQNNFEINGQPQAPAIVGQYLDMVEVPGWDGNPAHPFPSVKLLLDFRGPDIGDFVFHCHILNHEDLGMMNIIRVVAPSNGWNANQTRLTGTGDDASAASAKSSVSNVKGVAFSTVSGGGSK